MALTSVAVVDEDRELMPLMEALYVLTEAHTRDDDLAGFCVEMGARSYHPRYIKAWQSLRHAVGRPAFASPPKPSNSQSGS
jgi:hypothetical protein